MMKANKNLAVLLIGASACFATAASAQETALEEMVEMAEERITYHDHAAALCDQVNDEIAPALQAAGIDGSLVGEFNADAMNCTVYFRDERVNSYEGRYIREDRINGELARDLTGRMSYDDLLLLRNAPGSPANS